MTPADRSAPAVAADLRLLVADTLALYLKTKGFHWHVRGPGFRDHHLLFDEQGDQLLATTDAMAERARAIGGDAVHSISDVAALARIAIDSRPGLAAEAMLEELARDNRAFVRSLVALHAVSDGAGDRATTSLVEGWIDEAERRAWFLDSARG